MPWKPSEPGEVPTLGWYVIDWMTAMLASPAADEYEPFVPYREQEDFILRWYALDPDTCRFVYRRGLIGRPRGWGKSPLLAALCAVEALGDVVPDGWDSEGQPVGRPWRSVRTPLVQLAAVSEEQTMNSWQPLLEMMRGGPVMDEFPGLQPFDTQIVLPRGRIEQVTASAGTVKGAPATFAILDQTEEWTLPGHHRLANNMRTNVVKNGGRTLESPNAYVPGDNSVAEKAASWFDLQSEGRTVVKTLLYDHREAPADTDLAERESLLAGLRFAYGDSSGHPDGCVIHTPPCAPGHVDLEPVVSKIWEPDADPQTSRSDFLNQITHASDSWIAAPDWKAVAKVDELVADKERIVLGFDGSRGRVRGKADATALVGCRVSDGHLFEIRVWEQPSGPGGRGWTPSPMEVDAEVRAAFDRWRVVGFYADPSGWETHIAEWESRYGRKLRVKASRSEPIAAWPRGKDTRASEYVDRFRSAVINGELSHDGSSTLTRHVLNARRRVTGRGRSRIYKKFPESPDKIDAAYAAVMAWKARTDALSEGLAVGDERKKARVIVL